MKKTILSVLVTLSMLFSFLPTVFADNTNASLDVSSDVTTVAQGDNITFTFDIKNAELVNSVFAKITYDPSKLIYVSSEQGNMYNYDYTSNSGKLLKANESDHSIKASLAFNENHDITNDTFFKVTFTAASDLEPGTYDDYLTINEATAFRTTAAFNLKTASVPAITVTEGDQSFPLSVAADRTNVAMGEDVTYTISSSSEIDLAALQLLLDYDKELLAFKEGTLLEGETSEVNEDGIVWASSEVKSVSGEIATLTFTAMSNGVASITAEAESAPTAVKANFPTVSITSDVSISVNANKALAAANDTITYTVSLDKNATVQGLQLDLDFSDINIKDAKATLGSSLANLDAIACDTAFNNGVLTILFADAEPKTIPAGTLAEITFTLASDLSGAYRPKVTDSTVTYGTGDFTADVNIDAVSPAPVTAVLNAVPSTTSVQAGDTVTYTVSIDRAIAPIGFETHLSIDPAYVDGDIKVTPISSDILVQYNDQIGDVSAIAFAMGEPVAISGNLYTVSFKTKADKNVVLTPAFTEIIVSGASVSGNVTPVSIFAESSATVNIKSSTEYALPGETVTYTVDLNNANAIKILNFDIAYNTEVYSDVTVTAGDVLPLAATTTVDKTNGTINAIFMGENALSGNKDGFLTIAFKVADTPKAGADGVTIDVKSDTYTTLTVNNTANTKVVSNYGHLSVTTDKTYVFNGSVFDTVDVTVSVENVTDLKDLSFVLNYDKDAFNIVSSTISTPAADVKLNEQGKITYVYNSDAINGDRVLLTFRLIPQSYQGYTDIAVTEMATTSAVDAVKASKTLYIYSATETEQILQVQKAIAAIGEVTRDNYTEKESVVTTARALYNFLTDVQKAKITNANLITEAEQAIAVYKDAAAKAAEVDALINAIGTVTLDSGDAITAARTAYDALDDNGKYFVKNLDTLTAAEAAYAVILADKTAAAGVDALIDAIGTVTVNSGDAITAARTAYDALNDNAKALVTKYQILADAEAAYAVILADKTAAAEVDALIDAIGEVTADNFLTKLDAITAAENAYAALTDNQKGYVTKGDALTAARTAYDAFYAAMKDFKVTVTSDANGYTAAISKQKPADADPVVILAVYDNTTNAVVKVVTGNVSAVDSITAAADTANTYAKAYVWNSLDGMTPYNSVEIVY